LPLTSYFSRQRGGFTLIETLTALGILALICTGVIGVISHCTTTVTNLTLEMQALEVAREQMEQVLAKVSTGEFVESGTSDRYPGIEWQTTVETFDEPTQGSTWARAVCSGKYEDVDGETQTVELTCWLARLTEEQLAKLRQQGGDRVLQGIEAAAEYAGVPAETIQEWLDNGLVVTEDGAFLKANLDLYKRTNGQPSEEEKQQQIRTPQDLEAGSQEESPVGQPRQEGTREAVPRTPPIPPGAGRR